MKEKIPKKDIIKRALEKDSDQFPKEENKEKFFQAIFQNIYKTMTLFSCPSTFVQANIYRKRT